MILNVLNSKVYIGKTNAFSKRWSAHQRVARGGKEKYPRLHSIIHSALAKHGVNNFEFLLLQEFCSEDDAYKAEIYWIDYYQSRNSKFGYNVTIGGISSGSGANSSNFGLKRTEFTIDKLRESHLGEKNVNYGKKFSAETRTNMSKAQKGKQVGENHANAILTWEIVDEIRKLHSDGIGATELSKKFKTTRANIYAIINRRTWIK